MKRHVIQSRRPDWDGWETWSQHQYDTLAEGSGET